MLQWAKWIWSAFFSHLHEILTGHYTNLMYEMHSYMEILKKKCTWIFLLGMEMGFPTFKVCRLNKSLYGFKQLPRVGFWRFTQSMIKIGYSENQGDDIVHQTLFWRGGKDSKCVCGLIVINRNNLEDIMELKSYMAREFEIEDSRKLRYFLESKWLSWNRECSFHNISIFKTFERNRDVGL